MERQELESKIIEYIDGTMPVEEREAFAEELRKHPALYEEYRTVIDAMDRSTPLEAPAGMHERFQEMLRQESGAGKQRFLAPSFYRIAAAVALVMAGITIGYFIRQDKLRDESIVKLEQEMAATKRAMMAMINNPASASQRLLGMTVAYSLTSVDQDVIEALFKALREDANTNVRLAALEALGKFYSEPKVRGALIAELSNQKDPIVQIALIRMMVDRKETDAVNDFRQIIENVQTIKPVKDEALNGLLKLS